MKNLILGLGSEGLRGLMDCLKCPFLILDRYGKILFINKAFQEYGYTIDSAIPDDVDLENLREAIEREVKVKNNGQVDRMIVRITPLEILDNSETIFLFELCSKEKDLRWVVESWYKTIDAISEMIYVVDKEYNLVKLNSAVAVMSGNHPRDLIGEKCYKAVFGKDEVCKTCILEQVMASEEKGKLQTIRKEWDRSFLVSAVKIKNGEYLFIMEDITRVEQLERNLAEVRRFTSIGGIISHLRHSIGNAVNAIKCSLQVLEYLYEGLDDEKRKEYLTRALEEVKRMESLLYTLREFSKYEGIGSFELNLSDLVLNNMEEFNKYCEGRGVDFEYECEEKKFITRGDNLLIVVALTEILDNALEAIEDSSEKKIMFKYSVHTHEATVEITDTGSGISEEDLPNVAEPFFTTKRGRAGLGLYQAAKIIKTQGGDITFNGKVGKGTTVKISFREG
jgi:signal transduction histidine kinase